ncbi:hypothetical protein EC991_008743 [Linnemannia zychae]|nr:hypothetical protein EC991_008743 [Linnemannia zychae]
MSRPTPSHQVPKASFYEPTLTTKEAQVTTTNFYGPHPEGMAYRGSGGSGGAGDNRNTSRTQQQQQQRPFRIEHQNTTFSEQGGGTNSTSHSYDYDSIRLEDYHKMPLGFTSHNREGDIKECYLPPRTYRYVGIDLRDDSFAVGYVTDEGKVELIPNENGDLYTPADVRFINGGRQGVIGRAAWDNDKEGPTVTLTGMRSPERYEKYPEGVRFSLSRDHLSSEAKTYYEAAERELSEKEEERWKDKYEKSLSFKRLRREQGGDIVAVIFRRAIDMVEARLSEGEKVERIVTTIQQVTVTDEWNPTSQTLGHPGDRLMDMAFGMKAVAMNQLSYRSETLALAVAHVSFFKSRAQRDPHAEGGEEGEKDVYLPQTVLLYNLRDTIEDMAVMQYFNGPSGGRLVYRQKPAFEHWNFHIQLLGGYSVYEERIEDKWLKFVMDRTLERFNLGVGAAGSGVRYKERVEDEDMGRFNQTVEQFESLWIEPTTATSTTAPATAEQVDDLETLYIELGPNSSVPLTIKDWKELKLAFLKTRLSVAVEKALTASGLEAKHMVDHLIVADATPRFRGLSTQAMEAVFAEEGKVVLKEIDPERAIAKGVAQIAGMLTAQSILDIPYHCYLRKLLGKA